MMLNCLTQKIQTNSNQYFKSIKTLHGGLLLKDMLEGHFNKECKAVSYQYGN